MPEKTIAEIFGDANLPPEVLELPKMRVLISCAASIDLTDRKWSHPGEPSVRDYAQGISEAMRAYRESGRGDY